MTTSSAAKARHKGTSENRTHVFNADGIAVEPASRTPIWPRTVGAYLRGASSRGKFPIAILPEIKKLRGQQAAGRE
jgi:hypothetical protein